MPGTVCCDGGFTGGDGRGAGITGRPGDGAPGVADGGGPCGRGRPGRIAPGEEEAEGCGSGGGCDGPAGRAGSIGGSGWRGPVRIWPGRETGAEGSGLAGNVIERGGAAGIAGGGVGVGAGVGGAGAATCGGAGAAAGGGGGGETWPANGGRTGLAGRGTKRGSGAATGAGLSASLTAVAGVDGLSAETGFSKSSCRVTAPSDSDSAVSGRRGGRGVSGSSWPKYRRTLSATSSSIELEWVFFSVTPSSGSKSRILDGFTSSSRASSLIRILDVSLCKPSSIVAIDRTAPPEDTLREHRSARYMLSASSIRVLYRNRSGSRGLGPPVL